MDPGFVGRAIHGGHDRPPYGGQIQTGDKLPMNARFYILDRQADEPKEMTAQEIFAGKKVVLFGLPGDVMKVNNERNKGTNNLLNESDMNPATNNVTVAADAYVMAKWAENLNIDPSRVMMLADGDGSFHRVIGLTQTLEGLGERARRYSMYVEDGEVLVLNVDEPGPKSYKVSGPDRMLEELVDLRAAEQGAELPIES